MGTSQSQTGPAPLGMGTYADRSASAVPDHTSLKNIYNNEIWDHYELFTPQVVRIDERYADLSAGCRNSGNLRTTQVREHQ